MKKGVRGPLKEVVSLPLIMDIYHTKSHVIMLYIGLVLTENFLIN